MVWENIISDRNLTEENIIKKDILKTGNFNIVTVYLGNNQEILPHPEPYAVFFLVLQGSGIFTKESKTFSLQKGSGIYYEKNEVRGIKSNDKLVLLGVQDPH